MENIPNTVGEGGKLIDTKSKPKTFSTWFVPLLLQKMQNIHLRALGGDNLLAEPESIVANKNIGFIREERMRIKEDVADAKSVIEFEGDIPYDSRNVISLFLDVNEMIVRGFDATTKDYLLGLLQKQIESTESESLLQEIKIIKGRLKIGKEESDISSHIWWDMGDEEVSYQDFLHQILANLSNFNPTEGIDQVTGDPMGNLNKELKNMLFILSETRFLITPRNSLLERHIFRLSGIPDKIQEVIKDNQENGGKNTIQLNEAALKILEDEYQKFDSGEIDSLVSLFDFFGRQQRDWPGEDRIRREEGQNYYYFLQSMYDYHQSWLINGSDLINKLHNGSLLFEDYTSRTLNGYTAQVPGGQNPFYAHLIPV